jgi:5-methyltetrahydrofolate--homocysteine methyltransferase
MEKVLQSIFNSILKGKSNEISNFVLAALEQNLDPKMILGQGMVAAMREVGNLYEKGDLFVPEMLITAKTMQAGLAILKPFLIKEDVQALGKVAIGTVQGDLHDIGKNLVALLLEGAGFEVIDLGTDVSPQKFVKTVEEDHVDIIALSALLTTTLSSMQDTIQELITAGLRNKVAVFVGGAPVTEDFALKIGANGYAPDASKAVKAALNLVNQKN